MDFRTKIFHVAMVALLAFCAFWAVRGCVTQQIIDRLILPDSRVLPFPLNDTEEKVTAEQECMQPLPEIDETNTQPNAVE